MLAATDRRIGAVTTATVTRAIITGIIGRLQSGQEFGAAIALRAERLRPHRTFCGDYELALRGARNDVREAHPFSGEPVPAFWQWFRMFGNPVPDLTAGFI
jgi:hypothetical protein